MSDAEIREMRSMRNDGYTLQEIGDIFGISRERVRQLLGNRSYTGTLKKTVEQVPFIGLRNFIEDNCYSVAELCRMVGYSDKAGGSIYNFSAYLKGEHEMKMSLINRLIEITNIPYEKLFRKE